MSTGTFPDFYLVGAPKCGTTAMYAFLAQHPEIFLPEEKELLLFGSDLSYPTRLSEKQFMAHFAPRRDERRAGTAHTAYLQSARAAREISERRRDADIVIMLRNPLEMVPSWHSELLFETIEDIQDFEEALDAEPDRRRGKRIPRTARNSYVESLYYSEVASFGAQVERYLDVFGRSHVHVVIHDDLKEDPASEYRKLLDFLGVDPDFVPTFGAHNTNKVARSRALQRLYYATSLPGHQTAKRLLPQSLRAQLLRTNTRNESRPALPPKIRTRLQTQFRDDVARLSSLLDRDLSEWLT